MWLKKPRVAPQSGYVIYGVLLYHSRPSPRIKEPKISFNSVRKMLV